MSGTCKDGIWDFTQNQSIWPLLHVVTAYHAYMYCRNWSSVMVYYYILVAFQLLLFAALGLQYRSWFFPLMDRNPHPHDGFHFYDGFHDIDAEDEGWCIINCSALFIGGSIQTILGILMASLHVKFYSPNKYKHKYFYPVTFWKDYTTKNDKKYIKELKRINQYIKASDIGLRYGVWPWHLWFGFDPGNIATSELFHNIREQMNSIRDKNDGKILTKEQKKDKQLSSDEFNKLVYNQWKFRKVFWFRKIQLFLLSTPTGLMYRFNGEGPVRAGLVLYGLVMISLLSIFKVLNEKDYVDACLESENEDIMQDIQKKGSKTSDWEVNWGFSVMMNHYERLYLIWMMTCFFLIGFQMLPILTTFFRVLISSGIVIFCTLFVNIVQYLTKNCCLKRTEKYKKI